MSPISLRVFGAVCLYLVHVVELVAAVTVLESRELELRQLEQVADLLGAVS